MENPLDNLNTNDMFFVESFVENAQTLTGGIVLDSRYEKVKSMLPGGWAELLCSIKILAEAFTLLEDKFSPLYDILDYYSISEHIVDMWMDSMILGDEEWDSEESYKRIENLLTHEISQLLDQ